jgi:cell division protein ZapA
MAKEGVVVKILDKEYKIETEIEPLFVNQLAEYVSNRLNEVSKEQKTEDTIKIHTLTLITLAEEIFTLKTERDNIKTELERNIDELILSLDSSLRL